MIRVTFRHRAGKSESVSLRHARVMRGLEQVFRNLIGRFDETLVHFETESESGGAADVSAALPGGMAGAISYCPRIVIDRDHAMYDDVLILDFDASGIDYSTFVTAAFPELVQVFVAYRASVVLDEDMDLDDYDKVLDLAESTGLDVDGRDGVFRIAPVCFFDQELCSRAFGLSPEEVVERLSMKVESVRIVNNGVLIVVTSEIVDSSSLVSIDQEVRRFLKIDGDGAGNT